MNEETHIAIWWIRTHKYRAISFVRCTQSHAFDLCRHLILPMRTTVRNPSRSYLCLVFPSAEPNRVTYVPHQVSHVLYASSDSDAAQVLGHFVALTQRMAALILICSTTIPPPRHLSIRYTPCPFLTVNPFIIKVFAMRSMDESMITWKGYFRGTRYEKLLTGAPWRALLSQFAIYLFT